MRIGWVEVSLLPKGKLQEAHFFAHTGAGQGTRCSLRRELSNATCNLRLTSSPSRFPKAWPFLKGVLWWWRGGCRCLKQWELATPHEFGCFGSAARQWLSAWGLVAAWASWRCMPWRAVRIWSCKRSSWLIRFLLSAPGWQCCCERFLRKQFQKNLSNSIRRWVKTRMRPAKKLSGMMPEGMQFDTWGGIPNQQK